jgi:reactive chlorine resistance protein C
VKSGDYNDHAASVEKVNDEHTSDGPGFSHGPGPEIAFATTPGKRPDRTLRPTKERAMTTLIETAAQEKHSVSSRVEAVGHGLARYGLVVVVGWIGLMKFTAYEADGISGFVANSPLLNWVYGFMSVRGFSAVLGVVEVAVALLIAARPLVPRASAFGSALAVGMFLTTLSFLVTTPGVWEASAGGFPALSAVPGQFLIKDLALLGTSLWTLGEAWQASEQRE